MIVKVIEVLNKSEVYCEIIEGNPDERFYPSRLCLDPYICNRGLESAEALVGRTFDIGDRWTIYTILPSKFDERTDQPIPSKEPEPTPLILYCPSCNTQHIDEGEWATKPHKTHECQSCGQLFRPDDKPTVGISSSKQESSDEQV